MSGLGGRRLSACLIPEEDAGPGLGGCWNLPMWILFSTLQKCWEVHFLGQKVITFLKNQSNCWTQQTPEDLP